MSIWHRIANWVDFAVSLLCAVFLASFVFAFQHGKLVAVSRVAIAQKGTIVSIGIFCALLLLIGAILRAVQNVQRSSGGRYLVFETPNGRVSIRSRGVEQVMDRAVHAIEEVADASSALVVPKGANLPAEVHVRCRLFDRPNLLSVQDKIRAVIQERYRELFPGEEPVPVQVSVERILFEPPGPKALPKVETPPPGQDEGDQSSPLRPQYPVGE